MDTLKNVQFACPDPPAELAIEVAGMAVAHRLQSRPSKPRRLSKDGENVARIRRTSRADVL
jgi:hypothetical protein